MRETFKKAAAIAVFMMPSLFTASAASAADRIPDDPRYAALANHYKTPAKDCVLLDKMAETKNRASSFAANLVATAERLPEPRQALERLRQDGFALCIVPADQVSDPYRNLSGHFNHDARAIAINKNLDQNESIGVMFHELAHESDESLSSHRDENFDSINRMILQNEERAFAKQFIDLWRLGSKEYTGSQPTNPAPAWEIISIDERTRRSNPQLAVAYDAMMLLNRLPSSSRRYAENGAMEQSVRQVIKKSGMLEENYTNGLLKREIHVLAESMAIIGRDYPSMLDNTAPLERLIVDYLQKERIIEDVVTSRKVAEDVIRSTKSKAAEIAARHPEQVDSGDAGKAIYNDMKENGTLDQICNAIMKARQQEQEKHASNGSAQRENVTMARLHP